ncbi:hypothetical protein CKO12_10870, partial [Chromatium okenii]|uniref:Calx-beta domain-containing protein n=1 Tax=Chromatium okenii TaxID=61644 RepID=UPI001906B198
MFSSSQTILIADAQLENLDQLLAGLDAGVEPWLIASNQDAMPLIFRALAQPDLTQLHLLAHGAPGEIRLGERALTAADFHQHLNGAVGRDVEIAFWSCCTGAGELGAAFIHAVAVTTGARVLATEGLIGASNKQGTWELNGIIAPFSDAARARFTEVLVIRDRFEDNDTSATATNLGTINGTRTENELSIESYDTDWFLFTLDSIGNANTEIVIPLGYKSYLRVLLYDATGTSIDWPNVYPPIVPEAGHLSLSGLAAGTYMIAVSTFFGMPENYSISIEKGIALPLPLLSLLSLNPSTVTEGNSGSMLMTMIVTRSGDLSVTSTADWFVSGSVSPDDFVGGILPTGTVNFAPGVTNATITINVAGDTVFESNEDFTVSLNTPVNATLGASVNTTGTINNDDTLPTLNLAPVSAITEGNSGSTAVNVTVNRTGDLSTASSANWSVAGSGTNPAIAADFTGGVLPTGTVNFTAGVATATIAINVAGDTVFEPNEDFMVSLNTPVNATLGSSVNTTGTINNDDTLPTLNLAPVYAITEGNSGSTAVNVTVNRTGDLSTASSANWSVAGSGTNSVIGSDFTGGVLPTGTVNFAAGVATATIAINVAGDTIFEPNEDFTVSLNTPVNATLGSSVNTTGTINNDDTLPTLNLAPVSAITEGNSGSTAVNVTVNRTGDLSAASSANWSVAGSGTNPVIGSDFTSGVLPTGTVNFAAGVATATIAINVAGDTVFEPNEDFTVNLNTPVNATLGASVNTTGTINNDDTLPTLNLAPVYAITEGNSGSTAVNVTVNRTGDLSAASSANWSVAGSGTNSVIGSDFTGGILPTGTVNFAAGVATATIAIKVAGDTVFEPNEDFTVNLNTPVNATLGASVNTTGTINNDDSLPTLNLAPVYAITEGNSGSTTVNVTVNRTGDLSTASSANWSVAGSGTNSVIGSDFTGGVLPTGTVNFAAGVATATIAINVAGDTVFEPNENFTVSLNTPVNATLGTSVNTTGTINNDDTLPTLNLASVYAITEGNSGSTTVNVTVNRTGDLSAASSANWSVAGSGTNSVIGADFTGGILPTGTVNFAAGVATATIAINVAGDTVFEPNENFTVSLNTPVNATLGTSVNTTGTINNDDTLPTLNLAPVYAITEGNSGSTAVNVTVNRTGDLSTASSANWSVAGSGTNPAIGADFTGGILPTGTVNFAAGVATATIAINVAGDTVFEPNEDFTVSLNTPVNATLGTSASATGTINNDDTLPTLNLASVSAITEGN